MHRPQRAHAAVVGQDHRRNRVRRSTRSFASSLFYLNAHRTRHRGARIAKLTGHLDLRTTAEVYGHFYPDSAIEMISKLKLFEEAS